MPAHGRCFHASVTPFSHRFPGSGLPTPKRTPPRAPVPLYALLPQPFSSLRRAANFIPTTDILLPALTPKEMLMYAAQLRLEGSRRQARERVAEILEHLGLTHFANTKSRHLSYGQRRRASIALELVTHPRALFVDECTTGLDSKSARDVVDVLQV